MEKLLTTEQAAELLGLSKWYLQKKIRAGELKIVRLSRNRIRFRHADLETFVSNHTAAWRPLKKPQADAQS